jgi:hypothetical protein
MNGTELDKDDGVMESNMFTDFMEHKMNVPPLSDEVESRELVESNQLNEAVESNINGNVIIVRKPIKLDRRDATSVLHKIVNFSELKDIKDKIIVTIRLVKEES